MSPDMDLEKLHIKMVCIAKNNSDIYTFQFLVNYLITKWRYANTEKIKSKSIDTYSLLRDFKKLKLG